MNHPPYFQFDSHGRLAVCHPAHASRTTAIEEMLSRARYTKTHLPLVMYFKHILFDRVNCLYRAFEQARVKHRYPADYQLAFPVKVNPQHHILSSLKELKAQARARPMGFEVGSQTELLAVLSVADEDQTIVCNGFKDFNYYQLANLASRLGYRITLVLEHQNEIALLRRMLNQHQALHFDVGLRIKSLEYNDHRDKFGIGINEVLAVRHMLLEFSQEQQLKLLHTHLGSNNQNRNALFQQSRLLFKLYKNLVADFPLLKTIDIGGGLALDSDGENPNRCIEKYADDVVRVFKKLAHHYQVDPPNIISETGRAMVAFSEVLIVDGKICQVQESNDKDIKWLESEQSLLDYQMTSEYKKNLLLNFSLFQSLPDHWGIQQNFNVLRLNKLQCKPSALITQGFDITCDPDGQYQFQPPIAVGEDEHYLELAVLGVGAYQTILGSNHNLFGKIPLLMVDFDGSGRWSLTTSKSQNHHGLLTQSGYNPLKLLRRLKQKALQREILKGAPRLFLESILQENSYMSQDDERMSSPKILAR